MGNGKVYLVGAGPGAPDLLTLRAIRILGGADIVFHDALIDKDVLAHCPPECIMVPVGTRCGLSIPRRQDTIYRMLAEAAERYPMVVRLKGGDPCVFGRGGEDVEFLMTHGIPWEIVPGISAGIGGLSLLGLPVTHRGVATSVTLLTGSRGTTGAFEGLPRSPGLGASQTLVVYMSLRHVAEIAAQLMQQGTSPDTYALCASSLSYPQQRIIAAPLSQIHAAVVAADVESPALLVVGDVVSFWHRLHHDSMPVEGL